MAEMNDLVKLAVDGYHGTVTKYSVSESQETIRQALIEANGGSTKLDYRKMRNGENARLFEIIETLLPVVINEGLTGDEFFNSMVEYRNVAEGDQNKFVVEDVNLFTVANAADGTQGIRRQRLGGANEVTIPTSLRIVRIYEELNRVLSGRVDFNDMVNRVAESFKQQLLNDIYSLWTSATATEFGGSTFFPGAGSYSEDGLLDLIGHVEAAAGGRTATLIGTKKALRNLKESIQGNDAKNELHAMGYYGTFFGSPCVAVPQRHKIGTTDFIMSDNVIHVIAGDDKPIKVVHEGDPIVRMIDAWDNADLTQEYIYGDKYGLGIVLAGGNSGIGRYEISG